jgi:hypothetical protein
MDKIRFSTIKFLKEDFQPKGDDCNCWDSIEYKLPCPCIISCNPGTIPLSVIDKRWRFERDESKNDIVLFIICCNIIINKIFNMK